MSDEQDEVPVYVADIMCDRSQAVRNICSDLMTNKDRDARSLLMRAGEALLLGMSAPTATVVDLVVDNTKSGVKERPL